MLICLPDHLLRRLHLAKGRKTLLDKLGGLVLVGGILANVVVTLGLTFVSVHNYPGGDAIRALRVMGAGTSQKGEDSSLARLVRHR